MVFSSMVFLFVFLPVTLFFYVLVKKSIRPFVLIFSSLFFYAWGDLQNTGYLLLVCLMNFVVGHGISLAKIRWLKNIILSAGIVFDIVFLGYFKYFNFLLDNLHTFFHTTYAAETIIMPLGTSFFIFQVITYLVDVYRQAVPVQKDFSKFLIYVTFFPKLLQGPIVKYHDMLPDLEKNKTTFDDIAYGMRRFIIGLGKKVLLANQLGLVADQIFSTGVNEIDLSVAWLGAITYSLQLYFDFSGYSDMAIGLGRLFGFHFAENFNYPYLSKSITEFWRRWHISLGAWFKEYIYIPLGGNRRGTGRTYINLIAVFFITGIWHGANWTFLLWGMWHGLFIVIERFFGNYVPMSRGKMLFCQLYTSLAFVLGWVMFRSDSIEQGMQYISVMLHFTSPVYIPYGISFYLTNKFILVLFISLLACTPVMKYILKTVFFETNIWGQVLFKLYMAGLLLLSAAYLSASTYNPFIYFRF